MNELAVSTSGFWASNYGAIPALGIITQGYWLTGAAALDGEGSFMLYWWG